MFVIIGILVVFGAVVGGYLMEHGNIRVLLQPAELLIIGGAASGTVLIANPLHILKKIIAGLTGVMKGSKFTKERYLESLKMMYEFLNKARKEGLVGIESDVEEPSKSAIFSKYPSFLNDHHLRDFVCDTMRTAITGGVEPFDFDQMMEIDMEVHHQQTSKPISALSTTADSLPGLHCCCGSGSGDYHGRVGWSSGRNWSKSSRRTGGNFSGNFALLWISRPLGGEHGDRCG
jgi:chemotaxis protein MotA